jgi:hypothetical protein
MSRRYAVALCTALAAVCSLAVGLATAPRGQIEMMILTGIFAALTVLIKKKLTMIADNNHKTSQ